MRKSDILREWLVKKAGDAKQRLTDEKSLAAAMKAKEETQVEKDVQRKEDYEQGRAKRLEVAEKLKNELMMRQGTPPTEEEVSVHTHVHVAEDAE